MDCNIKIRFQQSFEDIERDMKRLQKEMEAPEFDFNPSRYRDFEYFKLVAVDHIDATVDELTSATACRDWEAIKEQLKDFHYLSSEILRICKIFTK